MSLTNSNTYIEPTAGTSLNTARLQQNDNFRSLLTNFKSTVRPASLNITAAGVSLGEQDGMLYRSATTNALYISDTVHKKSTRVGGNFTRVGIGNRVENGIVALAANAATYEIGELVATVSENGSIAANSRLYLCVSNAVTANSAAGFLDVGIPQGYSVGTLNNVTFSGQSVTAISFLATANVGIGTSSPRTTLDVAGPVGVGNVAAAAYLGQSLSVLKQAEYTPGITNGGPGTSAINIITNTTLPNGSYMGGIAWARMASNGGTIGAALSAIGETTTTSGLAFFAGSTPVERMRITSTGNVGIGTSSPTSQLQVFSGASATPSVVTIGSTTAGLGLRIGASDTISTDNPAIYNSFTTGPTGLAGDIIYKPRTGASPRSHVFYTGGTPTESMRINSNGRVGIGTTTPQSPLQVVGTITATDFNSISDARLKSNVVTLSNALSMVTSLRGTSFDIAGKKSIGLIAQELETVLPEVVSDGDIKTVSYGNIVALLIEAIKELNAEVQHLKSNK